MVMCYLYGSYILRSKWTETCTILPGKGLSLLHLNARSVRNKFAQIKIELWNKGIDILCFSESWLTSINKDSDFDLDGYNLFRVDRERPIRAGGICIYVSEELTCSSQILQHLNTSNIDIEVHWLVISKGKSKKIILGNVYRPPEGNKGLFIQSLQTLVGQIENLDRHEVILTGDFNINVLLEDNVKENLLSTFEEFSLRQLITTPTRIAEQQTCIDLIFTNIINVSSSGCSKNKPFGPFTCLHKN